eukprot:745125-Pelagomonas_calceolata.AAC.1
MLLRKLSNPAWQVWLACVLLPTNTRLHTAYMPTYGSSRRMSYKGYKGRRPQSRRLTASLFNNTHEAMKKKKKFVVILV